MKHTPTPWYYDQEEAEIRCEERDYLIANIEPQDITEPEDLFNGEHIVKCVNAYEGLVAALRECMDFMPNKGTNIISWQVYQRAKEALKAAGETA